MGYFLVEDEKKKKDDAIVEEDGGIEEATRVKGETEVGGSGHVSGGSSVKKDSKNKNIAKRYRKEFGNLSDDEIKEKAGKKDPFVYMSEELDRKKKEEENKKINKLNEKKIARIRRELNTPIYCGPDETGKTKALQTGWNYLGNQTIKKFYKPQVDEEALNKLLSERGADIQTPILTRLINGSKLSDDALTAMYIKQGYKQEAITNALKARVAEKPATEPNKLKKNEKPAKENRQKHGQLKSVKLALGIGIPLAAIVLSGIGIGAGHDAYKNIASDMLNQRLSDYLVAFLEERGVTAEQIKNNEEFAAAFNEYAQERLTADVAHKDLIQKTAIKTAMKKAGDLNKKFEVSPIAEETKQDFAELNDEQRQQIKESLGSFLGTNSNAVIQNVYGKITTEGDKQYVRFLVKNEGEATDYMLKVAINGTGITNNEGLVNHLKNNPINSEDVKRYERIYNVFKDEVARDAIIDKCEELAGEELENGECFVSVTNEHGDRGNKVTVDFEELGTTEKEHVTIVVNNFASVANASKEVAIQAIEAIANPTLEMPELPGNTITGSAGADVQVAHTPLPGVVTSTEYDIVFPDGTKISSTDLDGLNM